MRTNAISINNSLSDIKYSARNWENKIDVAKEVWHNSATSINESSSSNLTEMEDQLIALPIRPQMRLRQRVS